MRSLPRGTGWIRWRRSSWPGRLQAVANCADGLVAVLGAWGARVETTMRESGPWERVHPVGYVDAMAAAEMSAGDRGDRGPGGSEGRARRGTG